MNGDLNVKQLYWLSCCSCGIAQIEVEFSNLKIEIVGFWLFLSQSVVSHEDHLLFK